MIPNYTTFTLCCQQQQEISVEDPLEEVHTPKNLKPPATFHLAYNEGFP